MTDFPRSDGRSHVQLMTPSEAAQLLAIPEETVEAWIADEAIPFVRLHDGEVLIPQQGLLTCLPHLLDL